MSSRTSLRRRPSRTIPATIAGVVLLALGAGAVVTPILRLATGSWPNVVSAPAGTLTSLPWFSPTMITIAVVIAVVGILAIISSIKPGVLSSLPLTIDGVTAPDREVVIGRRSVARLAAGYADLVDGVDQVTAVTGRHSVRLAVRAPIDLAPAAAAEIRTAVTQQVVAGLTSAGVHPLPTVSVTVRAS